MYGVRSFSSGDFYSDHDYAAVTSCAEMAGFLSAGSSEYGGVVELSSSPPCTQPSSSPPEVVVGRRCSGNSRRGCFTWGVVEEAHHQPLTVTTTTATNSNSNNNNTCLKQKISSHHLYPKLLQAYIDFYKVGGPAEVVDVNLHKNDVSRGTRSDDPELDAFMETYCDILVKYKCCVERSLDETSEFISNMQAQLDNLCKATSDILGCRGDNMTISSSSSSSRSIGGHQIKERLMREYGEYMSSLKQEFSQRKKNGKLSHHASQALLDWWSAHYNWPYPTEAEKVILAASTGLDRKQINNWFINQRKRHWKPSKNIYAL